MSPSEPRTRQQKPRRDPLGTVVSAIAAIFLVAIAAALALSLLTYDPFDDLLVADPDPAGRVKVKNALGPPGALVAGNLFFLLGLSAFLLPVWLGLEIWRFAHPKADKSMRRTAGMLVLVLVLAPMLELISVELTWRTVGGGGFLSFMAIEIFGASGVVFAVLLVVLLYACTLALSARLGGLSGLMSRDQVVAHEVIRHRLPESRRQEEVPAAAEPSSAKRQPTTPAEPARAPEAASAP